MADIFSECFGQCSGVIDQGSPGPICGWTFSHGNGGNVTFSPGQAVLATPNDSEFPGIIKALPQDLLSISGITITWYLLDAINGAPQLGVFAKDNAEQFYIQLNPNGQLTIELGPTGNVSRYEGFWTPGPGTLKKVVILISNAGVPSVIVNDVASPPLTLESHNEGGNWPGNSVFLFLASSSNAPANFTAEKIFIDSGHKPAKTYCCP